MAYLQASIHFEKAAILFNVAAIASQLAVAADRTTDAGVKEAARLFQASLEATSGPLQFGKFCGRCWTNRQMLRA